MLDIGNYQQNQLNTENLRYKNDISKTESKCPSDLKLHNIDQDSSENPYEDPVIQPNPMSKPIVKLPHQIMIKREPLKPIHKPEPSFDLDKACAYDSIMNQISALRNDVDKLNMGD